MAALLAAQMMLQGCLGAAPARPRQWLVESVEMPGGSPIPAGDAVRLSRVAVFAPYDNLAITVLRPDGSVAFDGGNAFAAAPSALLREAVTAQLRRRYRTVLLGETSGPVERCEVHVRKFALDCRTPGRRTARVELTVQIAGGRPSTVRTYDGAGECDAADGNYTRAFSQALSAAMGDALR